MVKLKGPVIWIVEDDPSIQRIVAEGLKLHGFSPVMFDNAEKAYGALQFQSQPSLIILDMLLPGMSGVDLIRLMKQNRTWEKIPVVVVSILTRQETSGEEVLGEIPPAHWVNKPFETSDLMRTIQEILAAMRY